MGDALTVQLYSEGLAATDMGDVKHDPTLRKAGLGLAVAAVVLMALGGIAWVALGRGGPSVGTLVLPA